MIVNQVLAEMEPRVLMGTTHLVAFVFQVMLGLFVKKVRDQFLIYAELVPVTV